ncbi:MAG TPA: thioredoxin [Gemmatimonadota bacterium]|jgi:thioredoxin 1
MSKHTQELTDQDFETTVKESAQLAVVDFWASWCGPCRTVAPIVDELAEEYQGRITVYKVDVDANPKSASAYSVRSIPSILFFKGGSVVDTVIGAAPKSKLKEKIEQHA